MFHGTFEHALDEKKRLMIPAKLREEIPASEGVAFYVTQGLDQCLFAYSQSGWQAVVGKLQSGRGGYKSQNARNFLRLFFSSALKQELDAAGRLLLPDSLRERAAIRRDVILVGVMDHIEIWDRSRWLRLERANQPKYERFAEAEGLFG
jgi:MraZ protein